MPAHPQRSVIPPDLSDADLTETSLVSKSKSCLELCLYNLSDADLTETSLVHADLSHARPWRPNLTRANLCEAILVSTDFKNAQILACNVFGISAWELALQGATQSDLIVSHPLERSVTPVDSLELAQFIYLLLNNERLRTVIDTITSKVVVILGRFTPYRKRVLDAIRTELRCRNYLPVVFDSRGPVAETPLKQSQRWLTWPDSSSPTCRRQEVPFRNSKGLFRTCRPFRCSLCCCQERKNRECSTT
jgi:hypothetical protein